MTSASSPHSRNRVQPQDRLLLGSACVLLCISFIAGGSSQQANFGITLSQLLATPVLLYALWQAQQRGKLRANAMEHRFVYICRRDSTFAIASAAGMAVEWPLARQLLLRDLSAAGVTDSQYRWSLTPAATERDALSLLPAAALFFAGIALGAAAQIRLFWLVIALSFSSLVLGIAQVSAGQDSILNLYPQWPVSLGGIFANPNHQAASVAIALVLAIALLLDARSRVRRGEGLIVLPWLVGVLILIFVLAIPMIGSRAGPIIAIVPAVLFVLSSGEISFERMRHHRATQAVLLIIGIVFVIGIHGAMNWTTGEKIDTIRSVLTKQTTLIGLSHAPLGGGIGGFVPLFDQGVAVSLLGSEYINAAHNDYAQLWLEGGAMAVASMLAMIIWIAFSFRRLLALRAKSSTRRKGLAAALAMFVILLHSTVDYPLRTPALLAVFALLAGVLTACASMGNNGTNQS